MRLSHLCQAAANLLMRTLNLIAHGVRSGGLVWVIMSRNIDCWKHRLLEMVEVSGLLNPEQAECLKNFLADHHQVFSIDPGE